MTKQLDLTLWNRRLYGWLVVPLMLAELAGAMLVWEYLLQQVGGKWGFILFGTAILNLS